MEFDQFLNELVHRGMEAIEVGFIASVQSFDSLKMRGVIRPLIKKENYFESIDIADIENVPAEFFYAGGYFVRPEYKKGDLVAVTAYASTVLPAIDSGVRVNVLNERFSLSNCTIRNGVAPKTVSESSFSKSGMVMGKGTKILYMDNNGFKVDGDLYIDGKLTVTGNVQMNKDLTVDGDLTVKGEATIKNIPFSTHKHSYTDNGVPGVTGAPQ